MDLLRRLQAILTPGLKVDRLIGSGGMGAVFLAQDPLLRRSVAIKVLRPELATATAASRFLREARLLARLKHPNIVTIHEAREVGRLFLYVMDFVDGETLEQRIQWR